MPKARPISVGEVAAVIVVVLVTAGFIFPLMVSAKKQGYSRSDLHQLRQVATAGCLYNSQFGEFPTRIEDLVRLNLLKAQTCKLSLDGYSEGFENHFLSKVSGLTYLKSSIPQYPQSFITAGDFGYRAPQLAEFLRKPRSGWAVLALTGERNAPGNAFWGETYHRLSTDGSIKRYRVPIVDSIVNNRHRYTLTFCDFFCDKEQ